MDNVETPCCAAREAVPHARLTAEELVERWKDAPRIDHDELRRDIATLLDLT